MRFLVWTCLLVSCVVAVAASCGSSSSNTAACGVLGVECCAGRSCDDGKCVGDSPGVCADCGGPGQRCCDLDVCDSGGCCVNNICTPDSFTCPAIGGECINGSCAGGTCGALGQPCCTEVGNDSSCTAGAVDCRNGACITCGHLGEACCDGDECGPDTVCSNGACLRCGGPGEPCCAGSTCNSGCCDEGPDVCIVDGAACPSGGACTNNACVCSGGAVNCGNGCQDVTSNVDQCGGCGTQCNDTQYCANSMCACRPGLVMGPGANCIDPDSNPQACGTPPVACTGVTPACSGGACAATCGAGLQNCNNACVNTETNPLHCGECGKVCNNDEVCVQGNCEAFDAAVGCTTCPCAACGGRTCCGYPNDPASLICVSGGNCPVAF